MNLIFAALLFLGLVPASAAPLGFPGSTWGEATRDLSNVDGTGSLGKLSQGVRWAEWRGFKFDTLATYKWRVRSQNQRFYTAYGPALGGAVRYRDFNLGIEQAWQRYPELDRTEEDFQLYADWYHAWNLAGAAKIDHLGPIPIVGLPLSTWGMVYHDLNDVEGDGTMGSVIQAIDWVKLRGRVVLSTFGAFRWRIRSRNTTYFNAYGPEAGAKADVGPFSLGARHVWRNYPERDLHVANWEFFANWYMTWDLNKLSSR